MSRSLFTVTMLLVYTALPASAAEKLNVLLIIADDLRYDLDCYGSFAKTPHLGALAAHGLIEIPHTSRL